MRANDNTVCKCGHVAASTATPASSTCRPASTVGRAGSCVVCHCMKFTADRTYGKQASNEQQQPPVPVQVVGQEAARGSRRAWRSSVPPLH